MGRFSIEYPGAIYHVMNRGDRREFIFKDDADRHKVCGHLAKTVLPGGGSWSE